MKYQKLFEINVTKNCGPLANTSRPNSGTVTCNKQKRAHRSVKSKTGRQYDIGVNIHGNLDSFSLRRAPFSLVPIPFAFTFPRVWKQFVYRFTQPARVRSINADARGWILLHDKRALIIARSVQSNVADNERYTIFASYQTAGLISRMPREIFRRIMADCVKQFRGSLPLKGIADPFSRLDESMSSWDPLIFPLNGLNLCNGKSLFISTERKELLFSAGRCFMDIFSACYSRSVER